MAKREDDYLWDRGGEPDPEVLRLEEALGAYRWSGKGPETPARPEPVPTPVPARRRPALLVPALAAGLLVAAGLVLSLPRDGGRDTPPGTVPGAPWPIESIEGACTVAGRAAREGGTLAVGSWLETGPGGTARVEIPGLGWMEAAPGSRLRVAAGGETQKRVFLERGRLECFTIAVPRTFFVETPSATAVDIGCHFTVAVDAAGGGLLEVLTGAVSFEREGGGEAYVPAGASCRTRPDGGPGVPWFRDAPSDLGVALIRFERAGDAASRDAALAEVLAGARPRDTLTLWNLVPRVEGERRAEVVDAALRLVPGGKVPRDGLLAAEPAALASWRSELAGAW